MGWEHTLVDAIKDIKQQGGTENIMQPARLVSTNPPIVEVCGVQVKKRVHVNPAMINEKDLSKLHEAFTSVLDALEESKETEQVKELVENLLDSVDTRLRKNRSPEDNAPNLDSSYKGCSILCISCSNSAPTFEM